MSSQDQDSTKMRKSLKALQRIASDDENLVGRPSNHQSLKNQLSQETSIEVDVKRKNLPSKENKANIEKKVTLEDLTNPDGASETYWQILAEKRQVALQNTLDENEKLRKIIKELEEENILYKQMLDEANSFVEVIKELSNGSDNDTGIDVNDVSAADTSAADTSAADTSAADTSAADTSAADTSAADTSASDNCFLEAAVETESPSKV